LGRHAGTAKRVGQVLGATGIIISAGGFYLQTRSLKSGVAALEVQAEQLRIEKRRIELEEEEAERQREAAVLAKEAAERAQEDAARQRREADLARADRLFSMANDVCTLENSAEINSRLKLLGQIAADANIDSRFCLSYRGGEAFSGEFALPVDPTAEMTGRFGIRRHPILATVRMHAGVDWESPANEAVFAPADGLVAYAGITEGYGNRIVLDHGNGWRTTYSHLDEIKCSNGDIVLAAQKIGQIGATGATTGRHLHFEVLRDGEFVDPEKHLPAPAN
jgi:murein DD-endopeptidase MepM/ murein hydrolase activator NlpD